MRTNRQLVDEVRGSNPSAVEELISRYLVRMQDLLHRRRIAAAYAGPLCGDIFQTLVEAIRRNPLPDADALDVFVWMVARRRVGLYKQQKAGGWETAATTVAGAVLASMPERDREVLIRYYLGEQIAEQICETFQLTATQLGAVKSQARALFSAMKRRPVTTAPGCSVLVEAERCIA